MTKERAEVLLKYAPFQFAKTMPDNPHFYTLKKKWKGKEEFEALVQFIRDHGTVEIFRGWPYTCYYAHGYKYWTMGDPVPETTLINRAKL